MQVEDTSGNQEDPVAQQFKLDTGSTHYLNKHVVSGRRSDQITDTEAGEQGLVPTRGALMKWFGWEEAGRIRKGYASKK